MTRFEIQLAWRHLCTGGWQSALTIAGVAVAVTMVIFISSLIYGLQKRLAQQLTNAIPQVTVKPPEVEPMPLREIRPDGAGGELVVTRTEQQTQQRKFIEDWQRVTDILRRYPHVEHVSATVTGQAFIRRGARSFGITVFGAIPEDQEPITALNEYLVAGRYLGITAEEVVLGWRLAQDLEVSLGDRVRITSSEGVSQSFTVAGLYDTGQDFFDRQRVFVTLRAAQSLFGTGSQVTSVLVRLDDLYQSNAVADLVESSLPFEAESWMREFVEYVSIMAMQRATSLLIAAFSLLASSLGIASVLIVSVLQKSKEIGILKAMGARRAQILRVFVLEGLLISLVGSVLGAFLGSGLVTALSPLRMPPRPSGRTPEQLFPGELAPEIIVSAMVAAIIATLVASILPARRAAALDPVQVIRGG